METLRTTALLGGRFRLIRLLGEGSMGSVYETVDEMRGGVVALKRLRRLQASDIARFKMEFRSLSDLQHVNLVRLGELYEDEGQWFFTMERVEGVPLPSFVGARKMVQDPSTQGGSSGTWSFAASPLSGPILDFRKLRSCLVQLVHGLSWLHAAGKVHRDVKPSNTLVTSDGRLVLLDFGLIAEQRIQPEPGIAGTVAYMAPEQAMGDLPSPAADWYSVGVFLYTLLYGAFPFVGSFSEVLAQKRQGLMGPPLTDAPIPEDLEQLCLTLLRPQPHERPSGVEILRRLQVGVPLTPTRADLSGGEPGLFVGRQAELTALHQAFFETRVGHGLMVCLHGESGVGKTELLRRFVSQLPQSVRPIVLFGKCHERESIRYKALDGILSSLVPFLNELSSAQVAELVPPRAYLLPRVFPALGQISAFAKAPLPVEPVTDPVRLRSQTFGALRTLFILLAERWPVVLAIDDLQWSDADSWALLSDLLRPPDGPALLVVGTLRTGALAGVPRLEGGGQLQHLQLGLLSSQEAAQLARSLMDENDTGWLDPNVVAAEARGHPMFIRELVEHGQSRGPESLANPRLDEALGSRIQALPRAHREALALICLSPGPIEQRTAALAAGEEVTAFASRVAWLGAMKLVRSTGPIPSEWVEPYHDRVRESVLRHVSVDDARKWHAQIAQAHESREIQANATLAMHWEAAGAKEKASRYAERAADEAAVALAFRRAADLYADALRLFPDESLRAHALRVKRANMLAYSGLGLEAARVYLEATQDAAGDELELRRRAADQLLRSGHLKLGLDITRAVLAELGMRLPATPATALASVLFNRARLRYRWSRFSIKPAAEGQDALLRRVDVCCSLSVGLSLVDVTRGLDFNARTLLLALKAGEPNRLARAMATEAASRFAEGRPGREMGEALLREAARLARGSGEAYTLAWIDLAVAFSLLANGLWREGVKASAEVEIFFRDRCTGASWEISTAHVFGAWCLGNTGELRALNAHVVAGLKDAQERGDRYLYLEMRLTQARVVQLGLGDVEGSLRTLEELVRDLEAGAFHHQHVRLLMAQIEADLYLGAGERAHQRMESRWGPMRRSLILRVQSTRSRMTDLRCRAALAHAAQRPKGWERLLGRVERWAKKVEVEQPHWTAPLAAAQLAGVAFLRGEQDKAQEWLERSASGFDGAGMALNAAAARWVLGRLRGDRGKALVEAADKWMRSEGVASPERMSAVIVPGIAF